MPSQRPLRNRIGLLKKEGGGSDWTIPIYGVDSMEFVHETIWTNSATLTAPAIFTWNGDKPVEFNFKFKLVAGVGVESREKLFEHVKTAHALNAAIYNGVSSPTPPPPVIFILGSYIACKGIIRDIRVLVEPPWSTGGSTSFQQTVEKSLPTQATFSGTFIPLPGWSGVKQYVSTDARKFSRDDIKSSFYKSADSN